MGSLGVMWIFNTAQGGLKWNKTYVLNIFNLCVKNNISHISHEGSK